MFLLGWERKWINEREYFSNILKKNVSLLVLSGRSRPIYLNDALYTKCFSVRVCTFNILCIKKALLQFHFIVIGKMGDGSQAGKWNVTIRGHIAYVLFHLEIVVPKGPIE